MEELQRNVAWASELVRLRCELDRSTVGAKATSLLNKICPDNLAVIVDQLASIQLLKAEELEWVIRIIFKKALAEPHYCASAVGKSRHGAEARLMLTWSSL